MKTWKDLYEYLEEEQQKQRSCWRKGVFEIAAIIVDEAICNNDYGDSYLPKTWAETEITLLSGAENWARYVEGGCALISDYDIAHTLLTPSELKRWERNPDFVPGHVKEGMTMLDLEICAAYQAAYIIEKAYQKLKAL